MRTLGRLSHGGRPPEASMMDQQARPSCVGDGGTMDARIQAYGWAATSLGAPLIGRHP